MVEAFNQLKALQSEISNTERNHQATVIQLSDIETQISQLEQQLSKAKQTQTEYEDKLYQAYRYTDKMRARIESLETQEEDYTYFFNGVKHVLKAKNDNLQRYSWCCCRSDKCAI